MISVALAFLYLVVILIALGMTAAFERTSRLVGVGHRAELEAPKRQWGNQAARPPADYALARGLAFAARLVRGRTFVEDASSVLRRLSRLLSLLATASALALVPLAGNWGGVRDGQAIVVVDLDYGLGVLVFLILLSGLTQAATGLSERNLWARLGALRVAGQSLIGVALLLLVIAPLVLATSSLRLHDVVLMQQGSFAPLGLFVDGFFGIEAGMLDRLRLPNWFLFRQPLTAILIVPTLGLLLQRYSVYDTTNNTSGLSGIGVDADPSDLYWMGLESRLSTVLAAALFVALFLGAGGLPYFDLGRVVPLAGRFLGEGVPSFLLLIVEIGVFMAKLFFVLHLGTLLRRTTGRARTDQSLQTMTRRLIPLAWANLLLLSALYLLSSGFPPEILDAAAEVIR